MLFLFLRLEVRLAPGELAAQVAIQHSGMAATAVMAELRQRSVNLETSR
jgi:hypothetical protein